MNGVGGMPVGPDGYPYADGSEGGIFRFIQGYAL